MTAAPSLAGETRTAQLCDWAVREMLTSKDPVTQNRAGFVASQLDCVLIPDAQLEVHLLQGRIATVPASMVGRARPPWIVVGLINGLLTMSGAAFVVALAMLASWWCRHGKGGSADNGA